MIFSTCNYPNFIKNDRTSNTVKYFTNLKGLHKWMIVHTCDYTIIVNIDGTSNTVKEKEKHLSRT